MVLLKILPYSFFDWCENMPLGNWVKQTMWGFAIIETIHIMALAVLLGTMVVVDLRLLGLGLKRMPTEELDRLLSPWFWTSFFTMIVSGLCLFSLNAIQALSQLSYGPTRGRETSKTRAACQTRGTSRFGIRISKPR